MRGKHATQKEKKALVRRLDQMAQDYVKRVCLEVDLFLGDDEEEEEQVPTPVVVQRTYAGYRPAPESLEEIDTSSSSSSPDESFVADDDDEPVVYSEKEYRVKRAPVRGKRLRKRIERYQPDVPGKETNKREREAARDADDVDDAPATRSDAAELDAVHHILHDHPGDVGHLYNASEWFYSRYGEPLMAISSGLGREGPSQQHARDLFKAICSRTLLDSVDQPKVVARIYGAIRTKCCFCAMTKVCKETLVFGGGDDLSPIAHCCARLEFFVALRDGSDVDALDACFKEVMDAHAGKGGNN